MLSCFMLASPARSDVFANSPKPVAIRNNWEFMVGCGWEGLGLKGEELGCCRLQCPCSNGSGGGHPSGSGGGLASCLPMVHVLSDCCPLFTTTPSLTTATAPWLAGPAMRRAHAVQPAERCGALCDRMDGSDHVCKAALGGREPSIARALKSTLACRAAAAPH